MPLQRHSVTAPPYEQPLTEAERVENDGKTQSLSDLIRSGRAVLFAGSGTSIRAGFPGWEQLVKALEQVALACGPGFTLDAHVYQKDPFELLQYVDLLKKHIIESTGNPHRYYSFLSETFGGQPKLDDFHSDLVRLPFRGIVTTNYDLALEKALARIDPENAIDSYVIAGLKPPDPGAVQDFLRSLGHDGARRRVLHLHGCCRAPSGIILAETEYREGYEYDQTSTPRGTHIRPKLLTYVVHSLLVGHPLVFVGFGLRDPYLMPVLELVANTFEQEARASHFAIFGIGSDDAVQTKERALLFRNKYGVEVVFYDRLEGQDQDTERGLPVIMRRIAQGIVPLGQADWLEEQNATMAARMSR